MDDAAQPAYKPVNHETLRLALAAAKLGFWDHDLRHDRVWRSPEWGAMLGYEPDAITRAVMAEVRPWRFLPVKSELLRFAINNSAPSPPGFPAGRLCRKWGHGREYP